MAPAAALSLAAAYPALEALDDAWSPEGALRLLNDHVLAPGRRATDVTIEDISHIPGRACTVLYAVALDDGAPPQRVTATFAKDDRLTRVFAEHYGGSGGTRARPVVLVPERRCLIEFFGMDWQLPALARATDPAAMAPVLSPLGCEPPAAVEVLRYRPHQRCVLRYEACGRRVIGKVYRRGEQAARVWEATRELHREGFPLAAPLRRVEGSLLLFEHVSGAASDIDGLVSAAAGAAAALHAFPPGSGEPHTFASELAQLRRRLERMAPAAPALAAQASRVLDRLPELPCERLTLVHGDFKPDQLVPTGDGVVVLDFDRVAPGDPAADLGNFIAQLHREALAPGRDGLRDLAEPFLAEYERLTGATGVAERARAFRTLALVRMAVRRLVHFPHLYARAGAPSPPEPLLAEARSCLD